MKTKYNSRKGVLFIFIIYFSSFGLSYCGNNKQINMTIYNNSYNSSSYYVEISIKEINSYIKDSKCKVGFIKNITTFEEIEQIRDYNNSNWCFFFDNFTNFTDCNSFPFKNASHNNSNIILWNTNLISNITYLSTYNLTFFCPSLNSNNLTNEPYKYKKVIYSLDYLKETMKSFLYFNKFIEYQKIPINYYTILTIVLLVLAFFLVVAWHIKLKLTNPSSVFFIQKFLIFLLYINLVVQINYILEVFLCLKDNSNDELIDIYIEIALITINTLYKTALWLIIILIESGWMITKKRIEKEEMKKFFSIYIFLYSLISLDQIIDNPGEKILVVR